MFSRLESTLEAKMKQIEAMLEPLIRETSSINHYFPQSSSIASVDPVGGSRLVAVTPHPTTLHPGSGERVRAAASADAGLGFRV